MGNIFTIFLRVFPIIAFILLEIASFYTISCYNEFYRSNFINRSNSVVGGFYKEVESYKNYFQLKSQNESLLSENSELKKGLYNMRMALNEKIDDSLMSIQKQQLPINFDVISAKVINNSVSNARNYILINKGSKDGVVKDMSVISDKGPVGIVIEVSENYSCLMSFINKDAIFSARVKSTEHVGQLKWNGGDIRIADLDEIPKHIKLKKGDEIVTSGYSSYFPENIPIGKVIQQKDDKLNNFANIKVALYNDFSNLSYVYLIKNTKQTEIQTIEKKVIELQSTSKNEQ